MRVNERLAGRVVCATVGTVGALLLVSACNTGTSGPAAATTTGPVTSSAAPVATTPPASTPPATTAGAPAAQSSATPRCHTKDLSIALGAKKSTDTPQSVQGQLGALDHEEVPVIYTNISGHTCTMFGFGGVDLHGPSDAPGEPGFARQGPVFSVPRDGLAAKVVRLAPGAHAHVAIDYIVSDAQVKWQPTSIVVTPPDETTQLTATWNTGDSVLLDSEGRVGEPSLQPVTAGN